MKHSIKIISLLLAFVLSFTILAVPAFADTAQYTPGISTKSSLPGVGVFSLNEDGHTLHVNGERLFVPAGTLLYYGNPNNAYEYVIIAGKALNALDVKFPEAKCAVGTPGGTFTARHDTATKNFQQFCVLDGNTQISSDGMIGDITWNAMAARLG